MSRGGPRASPGKPGLLAELAALGLLGRPEHAPSDGSSLPALCAAGALEGGLSVALDVRPDELLGPLCLRIGGEARDLRVVDARAHPPELWVQGAGGVERWPTPDVRALVKRLNARFRDSGEVRAVALLGEWAGAQQLWCIPKSALGPLLTKRLLRAENLSELSGGAQRSPRG
jgi:hypothetical protein